MKILIFRNASLGNTLVATPFIKALKMRLNAKVDVIVDKVGYEILLNNPYIDNLIIYDKKGQDRGLLNYARFVWNLRRKKYDVAVLLKRFFRNELIAYLAGIPKRVGFLTDGVKPFKLTDYLPYEEGVNIIDLTLGLLSLLGINDWHDDKVEIFFSDEDIKETGKFLKDNSLENNKYFALHFGGKTLKEKLWKKEKYLKLCEKLIDYYKIKLVLLTGPDDKEISHYIYDNIKKKENIIIAKNYNLRVIANIIKHSDLFIGNDSGPSHLADAVGKQGVILYAGDNVEKQIKKWKPKGEKFIPVYSKDGDMNNVTIDQVMEAITQG